MATFDPALLDAIEALPTRQWQGRVWRHMFNDYAPERINTGGARWNPRGVGAIYTCLERDTAIAEGQHMIDVQPRRIFRQRILYQLAADVPDVVDLTSTEALAAVGLTMADIGADDHRACQGTGGAIALIGRGGILVPSARHSGDNMVILVGSGDDFEMERISREILWASV